jgi:8-oxo-dGTP diphosphatase
VTVQAAGGIVARRGADGRVEVLVVHRPRYDDWSFPKGKLEPGETHEHAAVREVAEETGLRCTLGAELPPSRYVDRHGRPKVVRYWVMTPVPGSEPVREPDDEVDELRWIPAAEAAAVLTYDADRALLAGFLRAGRGEGE